MNLLATIAKSTSGIINHGGYLGLLVLMILESTSIPIILPAELVLTSAGYYVSRGSLSFGGVILIAIIGSVIGAFCNYFFASWVGRAFLYKYGKYVLISTDRLKKIERSFLKHASIITFTGRMMPFIKHIVSLPAGLVRMHKGKFALHTALGSGILSLAMVSLGYFIGEKKDQVEAMRLYIWAGIGLFLVLIFGAYYFFNKYLLSHKK